MTDIFYPWSSGDRSLPPPKKQRSRSVSCPYGVLSARQLGQLVSLHRFYASVYDSNFLSLVRLSLLLAMSGRVYLFFPPCDHKPPSTLRGRLNPHPCLQRCRFSVPVMPNPRTSVFCTQSTHSFSFPLRPLRATPSRFPNAIRFFTRQPLIRRSVRAPKSLLVRKVISLLSHPVISRAWLSEIIRWSGLLRCSPIMRSKTRWCMVRSLELCCWRRVHVLHPYRASIASAFAIIRVLMESAIYG